jgi:hypothetical protein
MTRLIETASETPKAAAEVISQLRHEISNNIERDNSLLEDRQRIMEDLNGLSSSLAQATTDQQKAIELLVQSSVTMMQDVGSQFNNQIDSEIVKIANIAESLAGNATQIADDFAGSAIELSSLGEAFTSAVNLFNDSNGNLVDNLNRIEKSLDQSGSRSDEQLGYYVAQAREIINLSMKSQQDIFEQLRKLSHQDTLLVEPASEAQR